MSSHFSKAVGSRAATLLNMSFFKGFFQGFVKSYKLNFLLFLKFTNIHVQGIPLNRSFSMNPRIVLPNLRKILQYNLRSMVFLQKWSPNTKCYKMIPTVWPVFKNLDFSHLAVGSLRNVTWKRFPIWVKMDNFFLLNKYPPCPSVPVRCTPVASLVNDFPEVPPLSQIMPPLLVNEKFFYPSQ